MQGTLLAMRSQIYCQLEILPLAPNPTHQPVLAELLGLKRAIPKSRREWLMNLNEWEPTIQKIAEESNHEKNESGKHRILTEWRAKLEKEPILLQPFQIDEIVREVRRRLESANR
jgi:hypothetical protein